jgi:GMP synthase (glutamine-hydrolysing)
MSVQPRQQGLLILDFGSQYTQLIARRFRELGVYCELWSHETSLETIRAFAPQGLVLSGGPNSVFADDAPQFDPQLLTLDVPILGICYGLQAVVKQQGGLVAPSHQAGEYGKATLRVQPNQSLLQDLKPDSTVWMSHGDQVTALPDHFEVLASTSDCAFAAVSAPSLNFYGLQFHPEVTHSEQGMAILRHFALTTCACSATWQTQDIKTQIIADLQDQVQEGRVLLGLSGGVDSSVAAMLLHQALGDRLQCVFVDHGLLRLNEAAQVKALFGDQLGLNIDFVDASADFAQALAGQTDPEVKRKTIGRLFVETFQAQAKQYQDIQWLAQGTIYPDVIESAGQKHAHLIKSHHNVAGLPETLALKLVEPLRNLFKDEVRRLGLAMDLPKAMIDRHPFPGPGLGVRVLGEIKPDYCAILRQADAIFMEALIESGWYERVAQAFAVFVPVKTVGVKGDGRAFEWVIALRAVETTDFMTARWAHLPYDLLDEVSHRIINEVAHVSRVVYDISGKPPATIEWE